MDTKLGAEVGGEPGIRLETLVRKYGGGGWLIGPSAVKGQAARLPDAEGFLAFENSENGTSQML